MYLRYASRVKDGKDHVYWRLVRSVRRNGKVRQEIVAYLGELDGAGRAKARALARRITGRGEQRELFEDAVPVAQSVAVRLDQLRVERDRSFGAVWLGWVLWQALGLGRVCRELLPCAPRANGLGTGGSGAGALSAGLSAQYRALTARFDLRLARNVIAA